MPSVTGGQHPISLTPVCLFIALKWPNVPFNDCEAEAAVLGHLVESRSVEKTAATSLHLYQGMDLLPKCHSPLPLAVLLVC